MNRSQKAINLVVISLALFILFFLLNRTGLFRSVDRSLLDTQFRVFQREDPNDKIALISIDEKSLNRFAQNNIYWPWPREFYQVVTDYLNDQGAEAVVFDILFDTPDFDRINVNGTASDNRFARAMQEAGNAILAIKTTPSTEPDLDLIRTDSLFNHIQIDGVWPEVHHHNYLNLPIPKFRRSANSLGNTHIAGDKDGVIRSIRLFEQTPGGNPVPSLAMSAYLMLQSDTTSLEWGEESLRVGDARIPIQEDGEYLINWYEKGGVREGTFPYYSFTDVVQSAVARLRGSATPVLPDTAFTGKIVFVGASASGLADIKSTPLSSLEDFPGMEIMATVLNNLLDRTFIEQPGFYLSHGVTLLLILLIVGLTSYFRPLKGTLYSLGVLLVLILVEVVLFTLYRYWLPLGLYFFTGFIAFTTSLGYKYFTEEREKIKLKSAFNHYVQPELVDEIITKRDSLSLGGEKKEITVLFADLADFTPLSEEIEPEELVSILNEYLGEMTETIFSHNGTVDKFIGDAIMAFWGAPLEVEDHAIHTCRAALHMNEKLDELNRSWVGTDRPQLKARFGINTGEMIVGNMGSENRFNYTVIGDSVNLAARLEPLNSLFGTTILISEYTFRALKDEFVCRQVGRFVVKGKTEPVTVFEMLADRTAGGTAGMENMLLLHREGMRLYFDREWEKAVSKFEQILQTDSDDGLAKTYIDYCKRHIKNPPGKEWTGTFRMMHK